MVCLNNILMKQIILIAVLLLAIHQHGNAAGYTININITGLPGETRVLLKDFESNTTIKETLLKDGTGSLQGTLTNGPRLLFVTIVHGPTTYWCNCIIGNEEVWLTASIDDFPYKVKISGSTTQDIFYKLNASLAVGRLRRDSLLARARQILTDTDLRRELKQLAGEMALIDAAEVVTKKDFIEENLQTHAAVLQLFLLRSSYEKPALATLYLQLQKELKESAYGIKLRNFLGITRIVEKGDKAYSFSAVDKDGTKYVFPHANGKYLLLDFTKNHCLPCVQSIKELKTLQARYAKQLEIVSFSTDERQTWMDALKRDQPGWLYVRDDQGTAGTVILNYGVESYPTFVLIDPAGIVIAKWSGYSENGIRKVIDALFLEATAAKNSL